MGGKNAIIVDDDADLDEAVLGVAKAPSGLLGKMLGVLRVLWLAQPMTHLSIVWPKHR